MYVPLIYNKVKNISDYLNSNLTICPLLLDDSQASSSKPILKYATIAIFGINSSKVRKVQ